MSETKRYDIEELIEEVVTLPSMPTTLGRISELLDDPDAPLAEVARVISSDPSIAIKTLRLVNSAYYSLGNEIRTVDHAVTLLGTKVIKNLTLTATVFDSMSASAERFLSHCAGCGVAMRCLAQHGPISSLMDVGDEAFVFGLLHDIGRIVFEESIPEECRKVERLSLAERLPRFEAERQLIGVDHAELGGRLAQQWQLAPSIVQAISGHHDVSSVPEENRQLAATLTIADFIASISGLSSADAAYFRIPDAVWEAAAIDKQDLPLVLDTFFESFGSVQEMAKMIE